MPQSNIEKDNILVPHDSILIKVEQIARQIDANHFQPSGGKLVLVGILTGSYRFIADLSRFISIPHRVEFIKVSTYGDEQNAQRPAEVDDLIDHIDPDETVIIVDDIMDQGATMRAAYQYIDTKYQPLSIETCALLDTRIYPPHYSGFFVSSSVFVYGYGLDLKGYHRGEDNIYYVERDPASG